MNDLLVYNYISERTGNWNSYIESLKMMLPYLAATGHRNYTKSLYWFLQEMDSLDVETKQSFEEDSGFVEQRTKTPFSRISPDLCIEQTLMASIKGNMGITRGRGFTSTNRLIWTLLRPVVCKLDETLRGLCGVENKEGQSSVKLFRPSRMQKDGKDFETLTTYFKERFVLDPDLATPVLQNISTGVVAPKEVSVHNTLELGIEIMKKLAETNPLTVTIKKADLAIQMPSKNGLKKKKWQRGN